MISLIQIHKLLSVKHAIRTYSSEDIKLPPNPITQNNKGYTIILSIPPGPNPKKISEMKLPAASYGVSN